MKMRKTVNAEKNLTEGKILKTMLIFALPMILGNLLQQVYNIADTMVVGRFLGAEALAAVGSAYTLMTFLTSVIIGLCMGSGAVFSIAYGAGNQQELKKSIWVSFVFVGIVTIVMNAAVFIWTRPILKLLQIPEEVYPLMYQYIRIIFSGILFVFLYNFFACLLRAVGNSVVPLWFLAVSSVLNIILDLWFVAGLGKGVEGAAAATVIAQMAAGIGIAVYTLWRVPVLRIEKQYMRMEKSILNRVMQYSVLTCAQQSVMNFGILMIQGLVNSFGTVIMAAFAVAVKIDTLAYMPAQEFGNAFSLFVSQNYGARKYERIRKASGMAVKVSVSFCLVISVIVWIFAAPLVEIFLTDPQPAIVNAGVNYLHIEGVFYWGIGCLFLLYGLYRGVEKPVMSLVLTVISLGTRVALAYLLAPMPQFGVNAIWWAIPVGWILADVTGFVYYWRIRKNMGSGQ
ncbi:MATE family efflux transporter [Blautia sp.]|uniref:MATE family efflux transporter n=1 Tax=Blautia sp. TaxID=1955243 RepID=UPI00280A9A79|nr:MATE family efflux transporter [Blautia sp.]MDY3015620.1 MATE family efflux transporter [Blautia sp.]MED9881874.1 MATE family efflux transporter [Blautia sp.]